MSRVLTRVLRVQSAAPVMRTAPQAIALALQLLGHPGLVLIAEALSIAEIGIPHRPPRRRISPHRRHLCCLAA